MRRALVVALVTLVVAVPSRTQASFFGFESLRRPFVDTDFSISREEYQAVFGAPPSREFRRAYRALKSAHSSFPITNVSGFNVGLNVARVAEALEANPRDPRAYEILGAYLSLANELPAAVAAFGQALEEAARLRAAGAPGAAAYLGDLEVRCRLNLANLGSLSGDDDTARAAIEELLAAEDGGEPHHRLAALWLGVLVFAGDDVDRAAELLAQAAEVPLVSDEPSDAGDDDSYFVDGPRRRAVQAYLEGVVALASASPVVAEERFREALDLEDDLHDASLALANALLVLGRHKDADEVLEELRPDGEMLSPETIHYNRGNVSLAAGEPDKAIPHFVRAADLVARRSCAYLGDSSMSLWARSRCDLAPLCDVPRRRLCRPSLCRNRSSEPPQSEVAGVRITCDSLVPDRFLAAINNQAVALLDAGKVAASGAVLAPVVEDGPEVPFPLRLNWARYLWLSGSRSAAREQLDELASIQPLVTAEVMWRLLEGAPDLSGHEEDVRLWLDLVDRSEEETGREVFAAELYRLRGRLLEEVESSPELLLLLDRSREAGGSPSNEAAPDS